MDQNQLAPNDYLAAQGLVWRSEVSFTGGTDARTLNRRFKQAAEAKPATVKFGVTPGTLPGAPITGLTLRAGVSTGSAQLAVTGDDSHLYLEAGKSYVVRYTNGGSNAANISNSFDWRKVLGGSWERIVGNV